MAAVIIKRVDPQSLNLKENVVAINRVTKVVKGGKNMSFSALVVVGDSQARVVGFGVGKAKEVPSAIRKGIEAAKKNLRRVHLLENTIPHQVLGKFGAGLVMLKPAQDGTGVIAGGPVRAVVQACGIPNVLTKSIGSHNPHNVVKATINALEQLRDKHVVRERRGLPALEGSKA
jgi:small subunit ribosomal protein S5